MQGFDWVKPCRGKQNHTLPVNLIHVDEIKPEMFISTWQKGQ